LDETQKNVSNKINTFDAKEEIATIEVSGSNIIIKCKTQIKNIIFRDTIPIDALVKLLQEPTQSNIDCALPIFEAQPGRLTARAPSTGTSTEPSTGTPTSPRSGGNVSMGVRG
jgi:hypothetical protein